MNMNFNVKVSGGKRTPADVTVTVTAVNVKTMEFSNGKKITDEAIAEWIATNLTAALKKLQDKP